MLARHTPAVFEPRKMIRNRLLDDLQKNHQYEIVKWPMHYPDELCMKLLRVNPDPNVILYVAMMKGITPIVTIGDHKAFVADFTKPKKSKRHLPKFHSPSYSNTKLEGKHLRDQKGLL